MSADPFYAGLPVEEELPPARFAEPGEQIEPVELSKALVCTYKAKPCKRCGKSKASRVHTPKKTATCEFQRQNGCAVCGKAKNDPDHLGAPESFNVFASGSWEQYQAAKKRWHGVLAPLLAKSGLPKGLGHVLVEGEVSFGDGRERDQGNHRVVIEKALGDVLVEEGYLSADTWAHYEFGGLQRREERGVNRVRLMIFAAAPAPESEPAQASLLG